jgi:quaternary ammonium compound-resistance protein SugE
MQIALSIAAAILFAVGGLFMKYSNGMTRFLPGVAVLVLFCFGATCQAIAMKHSDMGPVYILVLGLEAASAFLLSIVVLGERATMARVVAVVLIAGGIVLLERS